MNAPFDADAVAREAKHRSAAPADTKQPLFRSLPPAPRFPVDALGSLSDAAHAVHDLTQAPIAICAQSVLAAATVVIQAHYDIDLPGVGRRPLSGFFVSVAESGERKSAVDRLALRPVYRAEERNQQDYGPANQQYLNDRTAWETARAFAKKQGKADRAKIAQALEAIGPEPKPPPHPMLLVSDPTPEALILQLAEGRPSTGVFTDEGGVLLGGSAFNDDSRIRTGALFNALWDGSPIRRLRVGTGRAFLPGRRCSAHIMMQPVLATQFLGDEKLGGIGMLARTLLVAPETAAGGRMFREPPEGARAALDAYTARLDAFLTRPPRMSADDDSVLDPLLLVLQPDARRMWIDFHDQVERAIHPDAEFASIRSFASKLPEHAGRLAAILAIYADPETVEISADAMDGGIRLAQHYAAEMIRLRDDATVSSDLRRADQLLAWWKQRKNPVCHLAMIYQSGPGHLRDAATARRAIAVLEEHGWVRRLEPGAIVDGKPRREAWALIS